jgi:hypothetical protein
VPVEVVAVWVAVEADEERLAVLVGLEDDG